LQVGLTRRKVLQQLGVAALATGLPVLTGCGASDAELAAALSSLSAGSRAATAVAAAAPMPRAEALAHLRGDAGALLLGAAGASAVGMRALLSRRRDADLAEGRVRWVNGWLLTETEIAAANLATG